MNHDLHQVEVMLAMFLARQLHDLRLPGPVVVHLVLATILLLHFLQELAVL